MLRPVIIRYWGRKSPQLAQNYITKYSHPWDVVLDAFGGSGVFVKTALELDRRAIYIDLNPFAAIIARSSIEGCDPHEYQQAVERILSREVIHIKIRNSRVSIKPQKLFYVKCNCGRDVESKFIKFTRIYQVSSQKTLKLSGIRKKVLKIIQRKGQIVHDELCKLNRKMSTQSLSNAVKWLVRQGMIREIEVPISAQLVRKCKCGRTSVDFVHKVWTIEGPIHGFYWYPKDPLEYGNGKPFLKKRDASRINEFFLDRSLTLLSAIWRDINLLKTGKNVKRCLYLTFFITLARSSKMCRASGGTWPVNSYWIPRNFVVKNPYHIFMTVAKQMVKILQCEKKYKCGSVKKVCEKKSDVAFLVADTTKVRLPKHSVDYVLIDPPHTDEAQFFELSLFYTSWLKKKLNFKNELIINPNQEKTLDDYLKLLENASKQMYHALKPNRYLTVVLHEENQQVLKKCVEIISGAGFDLTQEDQVDDFNIFTFRKLGSGAGMKITLRRLNHTRGELERGREVLAEQDISRS